MKRKIPAFFILAFALLAGGLSTYAEEIPERLDGRVIQVNEKERKLLVDFEHPATGTRTEKEFYVAEDAGFKDFKKLSQLKTGDLVSLDYLDYGRVLKAVYIIHIPLEKTYFTHKEIAEAFIKINSNKKDLNVSKH